jgi:hypothetical protein
MTAHHRLSLAAGLAAALLAAPALAQDRPPLFPTRDVAVTYRVTGGPQPLNEMSMSWHAAQQLMRVDLPGGLGFMVADQQNQRGFMVMEAQRMVMDVPMGQAASHIQAFQNARFTRVGQDRVADTACTVWRYEGPSQNGTACITEDGVMLRSDTAAQGRQVRMEAIRIAYGPQPLARYQRPQGYQAMQMPQMPRGGPGAPPAAKPGG